MTHSEYYNKQVSDEFTRHLAIGIIKSVIPELNKIGHSLPLLDRGEVLGIARLLEIALDHLEKK